MDLSIVIPAYNEAHKIARDVAAASDFLRRHQFSGEVIIADDGSNDGTADAARKCSTPPGIGLQVLALPHRGKGAAVRDGMLATHGDHAMFADSGVCVPYDDALQGLAKIRSGEYDIANGSRKLPQSRIESPQSFYRRTLSRMFRWVVLRYMNLPRNLSDTQCGFKVYRGEVARELYAACHTEGFMFDLEILIRARAAGCTVAEFPVHWAWDRDSRLKPARILMRTIQDLRDVKHRAAQPGQAEAVGRK
jgi:dolichyl-phosphate beta-glucosyltransferase